MQLSDVDLTGLDVFEKRVPHEMFAVLRREAPVFWHEKNGGPGFWAITKYHDLKAISTNPTLFSSQRQGTLLLDPPANGTSSTASSKKANATSSRTSPRCCRWKSSAR